MTIVFLADSHWHHKNIIDYCGRPTDYDAQIWNNLGIVKPSDVFIHCGDVGFYNNSRQAQEDFVKIPSETKILVKGNHDKQHVLRCGWTRVYYKQYRFDYQGLRFVVQHHPFLYNHLEIPRIQEWIPPVVFKILRRMFGQGALPDADVCIHGHIHDRGVQYRWHEGRLIVNACVEKWGYHPILIDTLVSEFYSRRDYYAKHHFKSRR